MTQYLFSVHHGDEAYDRTPEEMQPSWEATGRFNEKLQASGHFVFAGGLHPAHTATTVNGTGAQPVVTDGPYLETKEWIGGFWVVDFPDLDTALQWATEASAACGETVEVRPFHGD